jgi:hypothetical protein
MTFNIDLNGVKNGLITNYHLAADKTREWWGHGTAIIKSGTEKALPYLQDKRIAAISLITVNLILIKLGDMFGELVKFCLPQRSEGQKAFGSVVGIIVNLTTLVGGVAAFAKHGNLPFSQRDIVVISVLTVGAHLLICK